MTAATQRRLAVSAPRYSGWAWMITVPVALVGLGVSSYLTYVHFTNPAQLSCPSTGHINCLKVTTSAQSEIFGHIPVAITGIAYFAVMLALVSPWAWRAGAAWVGQVRLAGAVVGLGMVLYLVFVEAFQLHALCLWCTGVHLLTFLLFLGVLTAQLFRPIDPLPRR